MLGGSEFRPSKAGTGGDVKKAGRPDPFAYMPLDRRRVPPPLPVMPCPCARPPPQPPGPASASRLPFRRLTRTAARARRLLNRRKRHQPAKSLAGIFAAAQRGAATARSSQRGRPRR